MNNNDIRAGHLRPLIQIFAFVRKEIVSVVRQPRLLLVLVVGPFLLLLLFAAGYDQQSTVLRTLFIGPEDSVYESATADFAEELERYVVIDGYSTDLIEAERRLAADEIDLIVVFPAEPAETVLNGEQAVITVLHNKLDPIQQTAVEVSAQVAVQELNSMVLEQVVGDVQAEVEPAEERITNTSLIIRQLDDLAGVRVSDGEELAADAEVLGETVTELDPAVAVRPFRSDTENLLRDPVTPNDFFAPAAIALLLQHMALTFAALGLVRDRGLGLFELFRVGPVGASSILVGKSLAYLILAAAVGAALLASVSMIIGVPFRGELPWVAGGLLLLVTASIAWGTVLSLLARSDTQAVQFAMLALLAGLFFGGFLLDLDAIRYPIRLLSFILPVTFSTRIFRDVMLRGVEPAVIDLVGLAAITVVAGAIAWLLMRRRLRME